MHAILVSPSLASLFFDIEISGDEKIPFSLDMFKVIFQVLSSGTVWLTGLFIVVLSMIPYLITESLKNTFQSMEDFINAIQGKKVYKVSDRRKTLATYVNEAFSA